MRLYIPAARIERQADMVPLIIEIPGGLPAEITALDIKQMGRKQLAATVSRATTQPSSEFTAVIVIVENVTVTRMRSVLENMLIAPQTMKIEGSGHSYGKFAFYGPTVMPGRVVAQATLVVAGNIIMQTEPVEFDYYETEQTQRELDALERH